MGETTLVRMRLGILFLFLLVHTFTAFAEVDESAATLPPSEALAPTTQETDVKPANVGTKRSAVRRKSKLSAFVKKVEQGHSSMPQTGKKKPMLAEKVKAAKPKVTPKRGKKKHGGKKMNV